MGGRGKTLLSIALQLFCSVPRMPCEVLLQNPWGLWDSRRPCGLNPLGWLGGPGSVVMHGQQYTAPVYPLTALGDEPLQVGILQQWQLTLYGSMWSPVDIKDRQRWVHQSEGRVVGKPSLLNANCASSLEGRVMGWEAIPSWDSLSLATGRGRWCKYHVSSVSLSPFIL